MNEEEKNKELRIKQQKHNVKRIVIISLVVLLILTLLFWLVKRNMQGTEISLNEYMTEYKGGNIADVYIKENKIQVYYENGDAHWLYNRESFEDSILQAIMEDWGTANKVTPNVHFGTTSTVSVLNIIYFILMIATLIFMIVFIMRQVKGANNKSFEFVKNKARVYPSKTKFSDVAGEDEEKEELEDVVDFLKNPKKYVDLGAKIPKGVLLVGPPGTGKTLLARAVAGEAGVPFFTISGSDFMELFVGVGASRVRDLFETAKKSKPCIIFIDEIDAVGRQRGAGLGGGNDEREQTLNQLLVQMDGFEDNEGIIVMAATNRVDILDPALLRPGRFDRRVNINIPDIKGREEILKVHAKNKPIAKEVDFKTIARITAGFTGAEIENLLNESAILVAKDNRKEITEEDIQKSIMKVTLGPQKRSRVIDDKDKYDTAVHESGHALVSKLSKEKSPVHEVSIIPRGGAGGYTLSTDDDSTVYFKNKLLSKIQMLLGGICAEKLYIGDISTGASNDLKRATNIARRMVTEWGMSNEVGMVYCGSEDEVFIGRAYQERMPYSEDQASKIDDEVKKIIDSCYVETEKILTKHKKALLTMANVLLEKETIYADEVDMIIAGKSKKDIINYIENKDKKVEKANENSENIQNNTKIEQNNPSADIADDLIKKAEERAKIKEQKNSEKDVVKENVAEDNLKTSTKVISTNKRTTSANKTTTKKSAGEKTEKLSKEDIKDTKSNVKENTKKSENNDKK